MSDLAAPGTRLSVRVQPRASRNEVVREEAGPDQTAPAAGHAAGRRADARLRVRTTAPASDGAANAAVTRLLAKALGIAPLRLTLLHGATAREKLFRID